MIILTAVLFKTTLPTAQSTTTQGFKLQNKTALWLCDVIQNTIIKKLLSTL